MVESAENRRKAGFEHRFYREGMGSGRFRSFVAGYKDSDLWIGVDTLSYCDEIPRFAQKRIISLRQELENYILENPLFATSFSPVITAASSPVIAKIMARASQMSGTGPMAAVAGAFSEIIGKAICSAYKTEEVVVENGGDLFLSLKRDLVLSVYAGSSPLSGKMGLVIPAEETPLGVCTSAGKVGPSTSFGKADAVMVACHDTALADAWATALGNIVRSSSDIEMVLKEGQKHSEILSIVIICEGKAGIWGKFPLTPIDGDSIQ